MRVATHRCSAPRCAFTLMEMALSVALLSLVLAAATAVVALAARSAPDKDDPLVQQMALQSVADQIALDAGDATSITLTGKHEVQLLCEDMTGDGVQDAIVYAWSGVAGDPLVRTFNGVDRVMIERMDSLGFAAHGALVRVDGDVAAIVRSDQPIASVTRIGTSGSNLNVRNSVIAQRFKARVPTNATSWTLTSVSLWLQRDGLAESQGAVQIWTDNNGSPGSMLAQKTFLELSLSGSATKETFAFSLAGLSPTAGYWIVVRASLLTSPCGLLESTDPIASDNECEARYNGSSGTWTISPDTSMLFEVRGDVSSVEPAMRIESRATSLAVSLATAQWSAATAVHLGQRPILVCDGEAVVDVDAPDSLLDAVAGVVGGVVDETSGLLGALLGGKGGK